MDEGPLSRIGYFIPTRYLPFVLYYEAAIEKKKILGIPHLVFGSKNINFILSYQYPSVVKISRKCLCIPILYH